MKKQPKNQHDIPSAYLRRFASKKNHVWCLYKDEYKGWEIEEKPVNADFFKHKHLYTIEDHPEPYAIEELFDTELENKYYDTIKKILNENQIEYKEFEFLSLWLYMSKWRSVNIRNDISESIKRFERQKQAILRNLNDETKKEIDENVEHQMKNYFLWILSENEQIAEFCELMVRKSWIVLIASEDNYFVTNDNPGFSYSVINGNISGGSISYVFSSKADSVNIYPLSTKYCLQVMPLSLNDADSYKDEPKLFYKYVGKETVDWINQLTGKFFKKYLISDKRKLEQIKSSM